MHVEILRSLFAITLFCFDRSPSPAACDAIASVGVAEFRHLLLGSLFQSSPRMLATFGGVNPPQLCAPFGPQFAAYVGKELTN
jgi:hypothetical protein